MGFPFKQSPHPYDDGDKKTLIVVPVLWLKSSDTLT
jgi:hypothetical protein